MNTTKVFEDLAANTKTLFDYIDSLDVNLIDKKPDENTWSVLENLEHLVIIEKSCGYLFRGEHTPIPADRKSKLEYFHKVSNQPVRKVEATPAIRPTGRITSIEMAKEGILTARQRMEEYGEWDVIYTKFQHGIFGYMTKIEWIYFNMHHTLRHMEQMKRAIVVIS